MTEKTMPALPFPLAKDKVGNTLALDHIDGTYYVEATHRRHGVAVGVDPVDLMRGLAHFVSEVEPVAWIDNSDDVWTPPGSLIDSPRVPADKGLAWVAENYGPLTPLYAHPPVTAEPAREHARSARDVLVSAVSAGREPAATWPDVSLAALAAAGLRVTAEPAAAPSVEQIAEVLVRHQRIPMYETSGDQRQRCVGCNSLKGETDGPNSPRHAQHLAEEIHALWSPAPGDAAEDDPAWRWKYRAERHLARVKELETELAEANEMRLNLANRVTEVENIARAEVERLRAALEERDELIQAQESHHLTYVAYTSEKDRLGTNLSQASRRLDRARAAVEADTEEARDD